MCHRVFMYDRRDKNDNSQKMVQSNIYIKHTLRCDAKNLLELDNNKYVF